MPARNYRRKDYGLGDGVVQAVVFFFLILDCLFHFLGNSGVVLLCFYFFVLVCHDTWLIPFPSLPGVEWPGASIK